MDEMNEQEKREEQFDDQLAEEIIQSIVGAVEHHSDVVNGYITGTRLADCVRLAALRALDAMPRASELPKNSGMGGYDDWHASIVF